ncbi:MAG: DUF6510 family protein [Marmoricola sp.]
MNFTDPAALDGNAAAGAFAAVFGADVAAAVVQCAHCHRRDVVAQQVAYLGGPGVVLRCSGCDGVLARIVQAPTSWWLDLSGSASWQLPG